MNRNDMLTGKCKEDFEKWLSERWVKFEEDGAGFYMEYKEIFYQTPFSMQYGVYVDFFDSVGVSVDVYSEYGCRGKFYGTVSKLAYDDIFSMMFLNRHEARTKAIEKANEIYNVK